MSKFLKLLGHYIRHPVDFFLLPVSIIFGYLHGLIKAKAMMTLNVVSRTPLLFTLPMMSRMVGDTSVQYLTDHFFT